MKTPHPDAVSSGPGAAAATAPETPPAATGNTQRWPLSEAQSGLWYAQKLDPHSHAFNTGHAVWLHGDLNLPAFRQAADQASREAQALRLTICETATGPRQWLHDGHTPLLQTVDCSGHENPAETARTAMQADLSKVPDPAREPLALQRLYLLGPQHFVWYQRAHHLVTDGYGMALWESRVCELYCHACGAGGSTSVSPPLQPLAPVMDEAAAYLASDRRQNDALWWQQYMQTRVEVASMADHPGARAVAASSCHRLQQPLQACWREQLGNYCAGLGIPWPDVLTALTALYCLRMSGATQSVFGIPYMGRLGNASARTPAMVMNVLPLTVAVQPGQSLAQWLQEMSARQLQARRHGRYRSEQLRRDLGLLGGKRRLMGPLLNAQPFYQPLVLPALEARRDILATGPIDDITIGWRGDGRHSLELEIEANPGLYETATLREHLQRLPLFVQQALQAEKTDDIALASPADTERLIYSVNATGHPLADTTLTALIEARMQASPDAPALEFESHTLSYAGLEQRTRALALALQQRGVGPDTLVAVAMARSEQLVVALVAILRAGGAYLPLDCRHPPQRLARIIALARPVCALVDEASQELLPDDLPVLPTRDWPRPSAADRLPARRPRACDLAYVIYTSGSTGEPKGVMIEHAAIVNRLEWMRQHYAFDASDRFLQKTPATFDVSVWEFFLPLLCGGTLVLAPPEAHRDPAWMARIIRQQRIGTCHFVPSMLAAFLAEPQAQGIRMRRIFTSGEALPASLRQQFHRSLHAQLHNLYGPTEAAVDVSYWPADRDDDSNPVPIGRPVWNTRLYVLDEQLRPLPAGVPGALYIGGVQLARGYLGRDDLTGASFLPDPFQPGQRIYRSGDLARWRSDGALEYLGRSDHQVKLRGQRIEPGEIEAAIQAAAHVRQASVLLREDRPGEQRLVAYLQAEEGFDEAALKQHLLARLPQYMVPAAFVVLQDWPVTANGKLDHKALPAPAVQAAAGPPPRTATGQRLAAIWADLLEVPEQNITADADFFSLGGDSLSAVQLMLQIQQEWQRTPGLGALFAQPRLLELAALIDDEQVAFDSGLAPLIPLVRDTGTATRAPLFFIHPAGGICWGYRQLASALAQEPGQDSRQPAGRAVYGLQHPGLDPARPLPESIDALAREYVQRLREIQPEGQIDLIGWSVGGIIAQAMAVELQEQGGSVGMLALLDAYPADAWRNEPDPSPQQALKALLAIAGHDPEGHPELDTQDKLIAFLRSSDTALGQLPDAALGGVIRVVTDTNRLIRQHRHRHYQGQITHIQAARQHGADSLFQAALWQPYACHVTALQVPFLHAEMTGAQASQAIARKLPS